MLRFVVTGALLGAPLVGCGDGEVEINEPSPEGPMINEPAEETVNEPPEETTANEPAPEPTANEPIEEAPTANEAPEPVEEPTE